MDPRSFVTFSLRLSPLPPPVSLLACLFSRPFQLFFSLRFLHWKTRVALVIVEFCSNEVAREFPGGARNSPQQEAYFHKRPFLGATRQHTREDSRRGVWGGQQGLAVFRDEKGVQAN